MIVVLTAFLSAARTASGAVKSGASGDRTGPGIVIDGRYGDWEGIDPVFEADPDELQPGIETVWTASNRDRLWLRIRLSTETILQRDSGLTLYVDTDDSPATGAAVDGLGADIVWSFPDREGRAWVMGLPIRIRHSTLNLRQAPTIASREFELALDRRFRVAGTPLAADSTVVFTLRLESSRSGGPGSFDTGPLHSILSEAKPRPADGITLTRRRPGDLRILTYNVLFDGCFERPAPFRRILQAVDPDILSLQEIYLHSVDETLDWISEVLPDHRWYAAGDGQGVILSRYQVKDWGPIGADRRGAWAKLEAPEGPLVLINPHPPCCENDAGRQREFDAIAGWVRDARASGRLSPEVPLVIAGDMNLVGEARQLATLLAGDIADTLSYGPAAAPDGDGTALADALPYHLSGAEAYTWRSDGGPFTPGRLDYIVYTDSVLEAARAFVLWTPDLPASILEEYGLERDDTVRASDHLPVVADFRYRASSSR